MTEIIEGEIVDEHVSDLVPIAHSRELSVRPEVSAQDLVQRLAVIKEAMETAMVRDVDFGIIPGTDKPALYKPGSEKLSVLFQLDVQLENEKSWGPGDHLTVSSKATVYHAPTGSRLGFGEGMCSTREARYAYRQASRKCPACGQEAIIKGKAEYGGGWVCFKKKNGCGAKYGDNDAAITGQEVGQIDNPAIPDLWNTVVKMAEKRARVDAVLAVTGASALFTQDVEDTVPASESHGEATRAAEPPPEPDPKAEARKAASRLQRMRVKIEKLAQDADRLRNDNRTEQAIKAGEQAELLPPGTTWGELLKVIQWRHELATDDPASAADGDYGDDWESLSEPGIEWLGRELKDFIDSGCSMGSYYDHVRIPL